MNAQIRGVFLMILVVAAAAPVSHAGVLRGTVSEVKEAGKWVTVEYQDPESGFKKAMDIVMVPAEVAGAETDRGVFFQAGDSVMIDMRRNLFTGMYETSLVKGGAVV